MNDLPGADASTEEAIPLGREVMKLEGNPVFRKRIVPWYDSPTVTWIRMVILLCLLGFSAAGIQVVREEPAFAAYLWIPALLGGMSVTAWIICGFRILEFWMEKRRNRENA